jgi:AcrR family transcriptional regulator
MTSPPRRRYRGAPPEKRRAERRERLIEAAVQVYGARGYRAATVKAVCEAAGLTERYFYESFANSEALLAAAYDAVVHLLLKRLAEAAEEAEGPPAARVRAILTAYFTALRDDPQSARLFLVEAAGVGGEVDEVLSGSLRRFADLIARTLGDAQEDPVLRGGVVGGVLHIALGWVGSGYEAPLERVVEAALRLCLLLRR